jgi:hypothetical protein
VRAAVIERVADVLTAVRYVQIDKLNAVLSR